jgi:pilus assembly protein Flp/PilA
MPGRSALTTLIVKNYGAADVKASLLAFLKDEQGLTMVEYAIAGALVTAGAVTVFTNLGTAIVARITVLVAAVNT